MIRTLSLPDLKMEDRYTKLFSNFAVPLQTLWKRPRQKRWKFLSGDFHTLKISINLWHFQHILKKFTVVRGYFLLTGQSQGFNIWVLQDFVRNCQFDSDTEPPASPLKVYGEVNIRGLSQILHYFCRECRKPITALLSLKVSLKSKKETPDYHYNFSQFCRRSSRSNSLNTFHIQQLSNHSLATVTKLGMCVKLRKFVEIYAQGV